LKRITVQLEEYLHRKIKVIAAERGLTVNTVMIEAAKLYLGSKDVRTD